MEIQSVKKIANLLGVSVEYLKDIALRKQDCYNPYEKTKKRSDGTIKKRYIDNPNAEIKRLQKRINKKLLRPLLDEADDFIHGARKERSVRTNAEKHVRAEALLSLDLANCFPNIRYEHVYKFFREDLSCIPPVARILTELSTYKGNPPCGRGYLPQGAPTSASLCNLILLPTMRKLKAVADRYDLNFTQFIDDLFFSGRLPAVQTVQTEVVKILQDSGWEVNRKKSKIQVQSEHMSSTGVTINKKASAGRRKIRRILREIIKLDIAAYKEKECKDGVVRKIYEHQRVQGRIASVTVINCEQGNYLQKKIDKKMNGDT